MGFFQLPFGIRVAGGQSVDADRYEADNITARNLVVTNGRGFYGLQVFVVNVETLYILKGTTNDDWVEINDYVHGVEEIITFPNHNKVVNDFISKTDFYYEYADNVLQLPATVMIIEVIDSNTLRVATTGIYNWSKESLIEGASYYTSENGLATEVYPEDNSQKLFTALSVNQIYLSVGEMFVEVITTPISYAAKFQSFSDVDTLFSVGYTGLDTVLWTDGVQNLTGTSVTFNWTNDDTKDVFITVIDRTLLDAVDLITNPDVLELNLNRIEFPTNFVHPIEATRVKRIYAPKFIINNEIDFDINSRIAILDFAKTELTDAIIRLRKDYIFESFIQPEIEWSISSMLVTDTVIYDVLNLNNMTINGSIDIVDNAFIEDIKFNIYADWSFCNSLTIQNSDLMKSVDFLSMGGILSNNDTSILVSNIGATEIDMDNMLGWLVIVIPDNGATGRSIGLQGGAPPSAAGLANKVILENRGINVNL